MNNNMMLFSPPSKDDNRRINLKRMFRLRLGLIVAIFALLAIPGVVAVWKLAPQEYTASADVRFLASTPRVMSRDTSEARVPYEKFLNTQISLMTGNAVLSQVLEEPEVRALPFIAIQRAPLEFLKRVIKAQPRENSELATISCTLSDRDAAKLLVDKVLSAYMKCALAEEADMGGERLRVLMKERDAQQADLDKQLTAIRELQEKVEMPIAGASKSGAGIATAYEEPYARAEEDVSRADSKVKLLTEQIKRAEELRKQYEASPGKPIFTLGIEDKVATDPRVVATRQELVKADVTLAQATQAYGDKSPQLEVERGKVDALKAKASQAERAVRAEALSSMQASLEKELDATRSSAEDALARKAGFDGLIQEERKRSVETSRGVAQMDELKVHADETRTSLRAIRDEIASITMESNAPARVKLAAAPSVPALPGHSRRLQLMFLVVFGAAASGLGIGLLRELGDQQIRSCEDIVDAMDSPVLAFIPPMRGPALGLHSITTAVADRPGTAEGNEFRKVLSRIVFPNGACEAGASSCMITSATQGDGKTSVACNLAIALAQANRRVLLMEVSPRGDVERALGMEPGRGLTDILFKAFTLRETARPTSFGDLYVLGSGFNPEKLTVKVASRELMDLIDQAKQDFDHVIIDTPPFLAMADAKLLAPIVDGVVLVSGTGVSTLGMVRQASSELQQMGAKLLGVVLNCTRSSSSVRRLPSVALYEAYSSKKGVVRAGAVPPSIGMLESDLAIGAEAAKERKGQSVQQGVKGITFMEVH